MHFGLQTLYIIMHILQFFPHNTSCLTSFYASVERISKTGRLLHDTYQNYKFSMVNIHIGKKRTKKLLIVALIIAICVLMLVRVRIKVTAIIIYRKRNFNVSRYNHCRDQTHQSADKDCADRCQS